MREAHARGRGSRAWAAARTRSLVAEGEGFEPPEPCGSPIFKTGPFDHSGTPPSGFSV